MLSHASLRIVVTITSVILTIFLIGCGIDAPTTSYQGYLADENGAPVEDGSYAVTYRLFIVETGGSAVYTENGTLTVANGLFNTSFGGEDLPTDVAAQELYLEVEIGGETLSPRQRLQGAPFAWTLVSGSVIAAQEEITRTIAGYDNVGAGLIVGNMETGIGGGSGIVASTFSTNPNAAGVLGASQDGSYGGRFSSENYRGLRTDANNTNFYSAAIFGGIGLYIESGCTGCRSAEVAQNVGGDSIAPGEFVAVEGVFVNEKGNPVMQVRRATTADDVIIGVAVGNTGGPVTAASNGFDLKVEATPAEGYVMVGTVGLFQAQLADGNDVAIGDYLTASAEGATTVAVRGDSGASIARVMSAPDADGMVWVMLGGQ